MAEPTGLFSTRRCCIDARNLRSPSPLAVEQPVADVVLFDSLLGNEVNGSNFATFSINPCVQRRQRANNCSLAKNPDSPVRRIQMKTRFTSPYVKVINDAMYLGQQVGFTYQHHCPEWQANSGSNSLAQEYLRTQSEKSRSCSQKATSQRGDLVDSVLSFPHEK